MPPPRAPKQRGEWVELKFMARAAEHGLMVSKPWGDSARYDFVVEHRGCLLRVQVKSTHCRIGRRSYSCRFVPNPAPRYRPDDFDFCAVYVIPLDTWYIFPIAVILAVRFNACLTPGSPGHKYQPYLEAWHLLQYPGGRCPPPGENEVAIIRAHDLKAREQQSVPKK
jgi:hypothetical protein